MEKNLKFFGNTRRVIKLANCAKKNMMDAKKNNNDLINQSQLFMPANLTSNIKRSNEGAFQRITFCTLLTGLPQSVTKEKIIKFFEYAKANPSHVHIMVNEQKKTNGRAFAEFNNYQDLATACHCHGNKIDGRVVSVKQIPREEMLKSLESQKTINFPVKDNFRPDPENNSSRKNVPGFEYEKESSKPMQVSESAELEILFDSTQESSTGFKDPKSSHREDAYRKQNSRSSNLSFPNRVPAFNSEQQSRDSRKNTDKDIEELRKRLELEEASRIPVKFEVKIKPAISKNSKVEDAFDSSSKVDLKRKLSKLSPDRSPAVPLKPPATKNDKNFKSGEPTPKTRAKSPSKDFRKTDKASSSDGHFSFSKTETRDSRNYKSENRPRDRNDGRRFNEIKHRSPPRSNARRSPFRGRTSRSPIKHPDHSRFNPYSSDDVTYSAFEEAVVQIMNVHPLIGSAELLDFFCEYDIDPDKIIRRINERGEPTGDVRVTFQSRRDAERAVRTLKGGCLNGLFVDMFLVN